MENGNSRHFCIAWINIISQIAFSSFSDTKRELNSGKNSKLILVLFAQTKNLLGWSNLRMDSVSLYMEPLKGHGGGKKFGIGGKIIFQIVFLTLAKIFAFPREDIIQLS